MRTREWRKKGRVLFLIAPMLLLAACNSASQFGLQLSLQQTGLAADANQFLNFQFNNLNINADPNAIGVNMPPLQDNTMLQQTARNFWSTLLAPNLILVNNLINFSLVSFQNDANVINPLYQVNNATSNDNSNNLALWKEFMFAVSNNLNSGFSGQIRFGLTNLLIMATPKVAAPAEMNMGAQTDGMAIAPAIAAANLRILPQKDEELLVRNLQNKVAQYEPNVQLQFVLEYGYWDSSNDQTDRANPQVGLEQVRNYVQANNLWNGLLPTQQNFYVTFNIQFIPTLLLGNLTKSFGENNMNVMPMPPAMEMNNNQMTEQQEEDMVERKVKFNPEDDVAPLFNFTSTGPLMLDLEKTTNAVAKIDGILKVVNNQTAMIAEIEKDFANSLHLSASKPTR